MLCQVPCTYGPSALQQPCKVGLIVLILQMRKLRLIGLRHTQLSWNVSLGLTLKARLLFFKFYLMKRSQ